VRRQKDKANVLLKRGGKGGNATKNGVGGFVPCTRGTEGVGTRDWAFNRRYEKGKRGGREVHRPSTKGTKCTGKRDVAGVVSLGARHWMGRRGPDLAIKGRKNCDTRNIASPRERILRSLRPKPWYAVDKVERRQVTKRQTEL